MDNMELRHKRNYLLTNELPIVIDQLRDHFLEALSTDDGEELIMLIFYQIQKLACRRYGIPCEDIKEMVQPADFFHEVACDGKAILITFEIDKDFIIDKCDSKFLTIVLDERGTGGIRVFCAEYDVMDIFGEKQETYFVCEPTKEGRHNNFGSIDNGDYETYIKRVKEVIEAL